MTPFSLLIDKIHEGKNPYTGFPASEWAGTWYGDPGAQRDIFTRCIERTNPGLIIEVGSFVGESAIHMAGVLKKQNRDCAILCVDTFYAGFDHWKGAREKIRYHFGRPDFYYKFIANVIANHCEDVIVPMACDSINAARILGWLGLVADLVYVDASHEEGDVIRDYEAYWPLLRSGGGLLADDLSGHFPGCVHDWDVFTLKHQLKPVLVEGEKALVIKP
jgi:cephalosporin hydroxylase